MTINELINSLKLEQELLVANQPFSYLGRATLTLEGGALRFWLYDREGIMLTVSPEDEEVMCFMPLDEELTPEEDMILYGGKEYEFSYEDAGAVTHVDGRPDLDEEESYKFSDYESDDGQVVRIVVNDTTGDERAYAGRIVVEEDIVAID